MLQRLREQLEMAAFAAQRPRHEQAAHLQLQGVEL